MKITYDSPAEFIASVENKHWFFAEGVQDKILLQMAFEMWLELEDEDRKGKAFWDCLEQSKELLKVYYNHRFKKPDTRKKK